MSYELHPHKALIVRIEALKERLTPLQIMNEAKVTYANYHNWQKFDSQSVVRWFKLLSKLKIDPLSVKPGTPTYLLVKKTMLTQDATCKMFEAVGFDKQTAANWASKGDPRQIENFKKVNQTVRTYELELQKA